MDWALIKTTLEDTIRPLIPPPAASPSYEPRWALGNTRNDMADPDTGWKTMLRLATESTVSFETRYDKSQDDKLVEKMATMKELTVEFRCEADFFDANTLRWAWRVADSVKTKLRFSTPRQQFLAAQMAIASMGDIIDASFKHGGRTVNCAIFEINFNVADCITWGDGSGDDSVDYFDKILLTSCIVDSQGNLVDGQVANKLIEA